MVSTENILQFDRKDKKKKMENRLKVSTFNEVSRNNLYLPSNRLFDMHVKHVCEQYNLNQF